MTRHLISYRFFTAIQVIPSTPLQPTILNKTTRKELKPSQRRIIAGGYLAAQKTADIQRAMCLSYSIINTIIEAYKTFTTGNNTLLSD